jgi:hypothetical protein
MKRINFFIVLFFTLVALEAWAQPNSAEESNVVEQRIESISSLLDENSELDYTALVEDLNYFLVHPLNLNQASAADLQSLMVLSDTQINALFFHIKKFGPLRSVFELQQVRGFDAGTIRWLLPFVFVSESVGFNDFSWLRLKEEGSHDLMYRTRTTLQKQAGFIADPNTGEPAYLGGRYGHYLRYRFQYRRNIFAGVTLENDIGESFQQGLDFKSAGIFIRDAKWLKALAIGDYQVQFGQGLTCWNSLGFGKSAYAVQVKKNAQGLRPYSSVNENLFFRGVAATVGNKNWSLSAFASRKKLDANVSGDSLVQDDGLVISSLALGGLHRTIQELADKDVLTETVYGGNIQYEKGVWKTGVVGVVQEFSDSIQARNDWYNQYRFSGKQNHVMGWYGEGVWRNISMFSEMSKSANGAFAGIAGFSAALHNAVSVSLVYRNYEKDFQSVYSAVFAEGSPNIPSNEKGVYMGMQAQLSKYLSLTAYTDGVAFPWLRYQVSAPSVFSDHLIQLNYKPDKKHEFYVRYRNRKTSINQNVTSGIDFPVDRENQQVRMNFIFSPTAEIRLHSRLEWVDYQEEGQPREQGYLVFQDITWKKLNVPVSITARYALFRTDGWNARMYAYENDVLYSYSIPPYYGTGARAYLILKLDIRRNIDFWIRFAQWTYTDRSIISSGNSEIQGPKKSDLTLQLRMKF